MKESTKAMQSSESEIDTEGDPESINPASLPTPQDVHAKADERRNMVVEFLLCLVPGIIGIGLNFAEPYQRPIPFQTVNFSDKVWELLYNNELKNEIVHPVVMYLTMGLLPLVLQLVLALNSRQVIEAPVHKTFCVYLLGLGLVEAIQSSLKLYTGYFRPNFYELCDLGATSSFSTLSCDDVDGSNTGRKSFPSAHAGTSFCGMLLFSLFLEHCYGKSGYLREAAKKAAARRSSSGNTMVPAKPPMKLVRLGTVLCYSPMLAAIFIAASRVRDNHHHPADVVGGALLGGSIASLVFDIWFR